MPNEQPEPVASGHGLSGEESLPPLVRRYVEGALPATASAPRLVRITQIGEMRRKPGGRWLRFQAEQAFAVTQVGFAWRAWFPVAPLLSLRVVDSYAAGEGRLEARLWGLVPLMRARGLDVAKGEAIRYLAELAWIPHAMRANPELEWRDLGGRAVEVATCCGSSQVAVRLDFDAAGDIVAASTQARPREEGGRVVETPWAGKFTDYDVISGIRIPKRAEVSWELPDGPFPYWRGTITSLETDYANGLTTMSKTTAIRRRSSIRE